MSVEQGIDDLIAAVLRPLGLDFGPVAFQYWRRKVFHYLTAEYDRMTITITPVVPLGAGIYEGWEHREEALMADDSKITEGIRNYIRHRTHDDLLMQKYGACYEQLESLFEDVSQAGKLKPVDEPYLQSGRKRISVRRYGDPIPEGTSS